VLAFELGKELVDRHQPAGAFDLRQNDAVEPRGERSPPDRRNRTRCRPHSPGRTIAVAAGAPALRSPCRASPASRRSRPHLQDRGSPRRRRGTAPSRLAARGSPAQTENFVTAEWLFSYGNPRRMPSSLPSYGAMIEASSTPDRGRHIRALHGRPGHDVGRRSAVMRPPARRDRVLWLSGREPRRGGGAPPLMVVMVG
jgi:hypothetical protein